MDGLTEGRIVHYVLDRNEHRAAIVVKVWSKANGVVNLQVFLDGSNDLHEVDLDPHSEDQHIMLLWKTSVVYSENKDLNTWHWIEPA